MALVHFIFSISSAPLIISNILSIRSDSARRVLADVDNASTTAAINLMDTAVKQRHVTLRTPDLTGGTPRRRGMHRRQPSLIINPTTHRPRGNLACVGPYPDFQIIQSISITSAFYIYRAFLTPCKNREAPVGQSLRYDQ